MTLDETHGVFHREADHWLIEYDGKIVRLPHSEGLGVLAHLIENPRRRFRASALLHLITPEQPKAPAKTERNGRARRTPENDFRRLLYGLRAKLRRAEEINDDEAAREAEREMEAVTRELAKAVGLAGDKPDDAGRIVTAAIAAAIARISRANRDLAGYLGRTIATGPIFSYRPE